MSKSSFELLIDMVIEKAQTRDREIPEDSLDGLVHDTFSKIASDVNNEGIRAQVMFLLANGYGWEKLVVEIGKAQNKTKGAEIPQKNKTNNENKRTGGHGPPKIRRVNRRSS
jgi:hypothetical protein